MTRSKDKAQEAKEQLKAYYLEGGYTRPRRGSSVSEDDSPRGSKSRGTQDSLQDCPEGSINELNSPQQDNNNSLSKRLKEATGVSSNKKRKKKIS